MDFICPAVQLRLTACSASCTAIQATTLHTVLDAVLIFGDDASHLTIMCSRSGVGNVQGYHFPQYMTYYCEELGVLATGTAAMNACRHGNERVMWLSVIAMVTWLPIFLNLLNRSEHTIPFAYISINTRINKYLCKSIYWLLLNSYLVRCPIVSP